MKKNKFFTAGILALALVLGLVLTGCDTGSGDSTNTPPPPDGTENNPFPLTSGTWTDGSITSSSSAIWYSFYTAGGYASYYFWWNDSKDGDGTKTADVYVSAYSSSGSRLFSEKDSAWEAISGNGFGFASNDTIKIKVEGNDTGTFAIVYSFHNSRPSTSSDLGTENNPIPLTAGTWTNGNISGLDDWYSFNVTRGSTYYIWWNDSESGDGTKTLDVQVSAYYSSGSGIFQGKDNAWSDYQSITPYSSDTIKVIVASNYYGGIGTFAIMYSTNPSAGPGPDPGPGPGGSTDYSGTYMGTVQKNGSPLGSSATVSSTSIDVDGTDIPISIGDDNNFTYGGASGTWAYITSEGDKIGIVVYSATYQLAFGDSASTINSQMSLGANLSDISTTYSGLLTKIP